ncbi:phage virion morphogenesis (putative tail completion) protein [Methylomagnum ishizawai]|uniref:Phage virion morphogenesis (Putative tail completion) protein n=1 Tax=Methylomagnum ishizawai TaxID=1760988 RepID=A0A1Y6CVQ7_9GAMM|nr:phage virion morphogenesis protein [Methylomagnum ishizawai]SMF94310.1 phage virion morphogenesis (putative tail completion) protein [Methylomagnum ishizawai]
MADLIAVKIDDRRVQEVLKRMETALANPRPMLAEIGEDLAASTKQRFDTGTAPDGQPWAPNSATTMARFLDRKELKTKKGKLNARGKRLEAGKKPLIGRSKQLAHTITYLLRGNTLLVGSPMIYAATQQFGAEEGAFGADKRGHPIPWGDIPARPFLGISDSDSRSILEIARRYMKVP